MTIKMENDKSLVITQRSTIYQGENGTEQLIFLLPETYGGNQVDSFQVSLFCVLPDGSLRTYALSRDETMHLGYLRYIIDVTAGLTGLAGNVSLWLAATAPDGDIFKTGSATIVVHTKAHDTPEQKPGDVIYF